LRPGDQVVRVFFQGRAGKDHAHKALEAAAGILRETGHGNPSGPWIPVGAGVHTGMSCMGTVGSEKGAVDVTALGDVPNVAAQLSSLAATREIILSEATRATARLNKGSLEPQRRGLKGRG
jgi:adenylate cyclase